MTMTASLRKFALTAHVTCSVGWLGAVAGFLALAVTGLTSPDAQMVRAAYLGTSMDDAPGILAEDTLEVSAGA